MNQECEKLYYNQIRAYMGHPALSPEENKRLIEYMNTEEEERRRKQIDENILKYRNIDTSGNMSVIVPTYNRGWLLDMTLPSIYNQPYPNDYEILVVDDASTDNTEEIVKRHQEKTNKIRYIKAKSSGHFNGSHTINVAIKNAKYNIILHSDPEIFHIRTTMLNYLTLHKQKNFAWIWSGCRGYISCAGDGQHDKPNMKRATEEFVGLLKNWKYEFTDGFIKNYDEICKWADNHKIRLDPCVYPLCVTFTREPLVLIRGYDEEHKGMGWGDNDLFNRFGRIGVLVMGELFDDPHRYKASYIHLYHPNTDRPDPNCNNQQLSWAKELNLPYEERYTIKGNMRNVNNWGEP